MVGYVQGSYKHPAINIEMSGGCRSSSETLGQHSPIDFDDVGESLPDMTRFYTDWPRPQQQLVHSAPSAIA